jgi:TolB-like protein
MKYAIKFEAVPKCQILEPQPIKTAVLQPPDRRFVGRKTARAGYKITNFVTGSFVSIIFIFSLNLSCKTFSERYILEDAAYEAVKDISKKITNGNIAVISISSPGENESLQIIRWLENGLLQNREIGIVSRQQINAVLREQEFGISGYVDDASAQKIGHILGAEYVLSGELINIGGENILNIQILEVETARLMYSNSYKIKSKTEKNIPMRF